MSDTLARRPVPKATGSGSPAPAPGPPSTRAGWKAQIDAETRRRGAIKRVDIDMGAVERLDTFGAWLLERLTRSFRRARLRHAM